MVVFSVLLVAILNYAQTNAKTSRTVIKQRTQSYAVDGTLESAVNWAKDTSNVGRDPALFPGDPACVYKKPASGSTPEITVSCAAERNSGSGRGPVGGNYPDQAIETLGKRTTLAPIGANGNLPNCGGGPVEDGIRTRASGLPSGSTCDTSKAITGQPWTVRGDVKSASSIKLDGSPLELYPKQNGTVSKANAVLACNVPSGKITTHSATSSTLSNGCVGNAAGPTDPNYAHRPIVTAAGVVPATCAGVGVTAIDPGTFTSAVALSNLFASTSCKDKYIWFKPGVYYFNFTDIADQSVRCGNPDASQYILRPESNRHEWCVGRGPDASHPNASSNNVHIVGGEPYNWVGITAPTASTAFPQDITGDNPYGGNCDPGKPGVQFIFGGDSRVYVADGTFELCAGPVAGNPNAPQVAIYGLKQATFTTTVTQTGPTCPSTSNGRCTGNIAGGMAIDGNLVDLQYDDSCALFCGFVYSNPVTVNFDGYAVPAGNQVQSVVMRAGYNTHDPDNLCTPGHFWNDVVGFINGVVNGLSDLLCTRPQFTIAGANGPQNCNNNHDLPSTGNRLQVFAVDITKCFTTDGSALNHFAVNWWAREYCLFGCPRFTDQLDGIEITVTLKSTIPSDEHPADGCIIDVPNYNDGLGEADCAVLKSDQIQSDPSVFKAADWVGRTSIKGTIYAPSDAVDFSDNFAKYPLFQRGLIARHLKIESYGYIGSRVSSGSCAVNVACEPTAHVADIDPTPFVFPRTVTFTACTQAATGNQDVCSEADGDKILGTVSVVYHVTPANGPTLAAANKPEVLAWATSR
ncbi:MAG: hypothetical protein JWM89_1859 [Acidimicrobiales bacterium]|nr:hypothetical protein [Acidimicrobiales bacterium]